jgi:hypothetical protein
LETIEISFIATGNPWIDCGIVGLHDFLKDGRIRPKGNFNVRRKNHDEFTVEVWNSEGVDSFLESAFYELKSNFYVQPTGNKVCILDKEQNEFRVVPKINLVHAVGFLFSGGDLKVDYGPKVRLDPKLAKKQKEMRALYRGRKGVDFKTAEDFVYASEPTYNWPFKAGKEGICSFCQRKASCVDIDSNNYPFAVGTKNFQNFFSNLSLSPKICSLCKLASLAAVNRVFFNMSDRRRRLFLAIPQASSLRELYEFWHDITSTVALGPLNENSNLLAGGYRYRRLNESIIAVCLELYLQLLEVRKDDSRIAEADKLLANVSSKSWHFYLASKTGKVLSFDGYAYLTDLHRLFQLFSSLNKPQAFRDMFQHLAIKHGSEWRTELRDQFAQRILKSAGLNDVAERMVWEKSKERRHVMGLTDFVEHYNIWRG